MAMCRCWRHLVVSVESTTALFTRSIDESAPASGALRFEALDVIVGAALSGVDIGKVNPRHLSACIAARKSRVS